MLAWFTSLEGGVQAHRSRLRHLTEIQNNEILCTVIYGKLSMMSCMSKVSIRWIPRLLPHFQKGDVESFGARRR
ncbi:hypothetical protein TNCV_3960321 [Trichonephila clavipes]|nr:hypothetical protein TNCV_3960321 [Trichonephila clavipes]